MYLIVSFFHCSWHTHKTLERRYKTERTTCAIVYAIVEGILCGCFGRNEHKEKYISLENFICITIDKNTTHLKIIAFIYLSSVRASLANLQRWANTHTPTYTLKRAKPAVVTRLMLITRLQCRKHFPLKTLRQTALRDECAKYVRACVAVIRYCCTVRGRHAPRDTPDVVLA